MRRYSLTLGLASALVVMGHLAHAADLRIGLQDDPDTLDPDQGRTFVGRIVFASMCDKLVDITPELKIIPALATSWKWSDGGKALTMDLRKGVTFQDGEKFDAEAVKYNIHRSQTLPESRRKNEVKSIASVEVKGPYQVVFHLKAPDATLLAQLADRAGMMVAPKVAEKEGDKFGLHPVCVGPYKFQSRVAQDKIVLVKDPSYYDAKDYHFDKVSFLPIPDTTVRLANLRAGDLDMIERLAATDVKTAEKDPKLQVKKATSLGYQGITFNIGNGPKAKTPFGEKEKLRQALSLSIDRNAINQVVFNGAFEPGNQPFPPGSKWYDKAFPVQPQNIAEAKKLLQEAGDPHPELTVQVTNNPVQMQLMQVIQAMAAQAGIKIKIVAKEFATLLKDQTTGDFEASQIGWSGRIDPDGNIYGFVVTGAGLNDGHYSDPQVDALLNKARLTTDDAVRKQSYDAAQAILLKQLPIIYLYHPVWIWALDKKIEGFTPYPDGMIRLKGVKFTG